MANTSSPASPPDPVSWQPAFWALFAVASSTALQDAGQVLGLAASYHIVLRTSPIVCLLDTLDILTGIIFHFKKTEPLIALRLVGRKRLEEKSAPTVLQKNISLVNRWLRWFVRALVVIATVKVFTFRNLPWTQAFAAVYFAAFVVQEVLNYYGPTTQTPTLPTAAAPGSVPLDAVSDHWDWIRNNFKHGPKLFWLWNRTLPAVLQLSLWNWLLGSPLPQYEDASDLPFLETIVLSTAMLPLLPIYVFLVSVQYLILLCAILIDLCIPILPACFVGWLLAYILPPKAKFSSDNPWKVSTIVSVCIAIFTCQLIWLGGLYAGRFWHNHNYMFDYVYPAVWATLVYANKTFWYRLTSGGWIVALVAITSFGICVIARQCFTALRQLASNRQFACLFLVLMSFFSSLVYYSTSYNGRGTSQASWAGDLP